MIDRFLRFMEKRDRWITTLQWFTSLTMPLVVALMSWMVYKVIVLEQFRLLHDPDRERSLLQVKTDIQKWHNEDLSKIMNEMTRQISNLREGQIELKIMLQQHITTRSNPDGSSE